MIMHSLSNVAAVGASIIAGFAFSTSPPRTQ
jgi:hypothetical protein